MNLKSKFLLIIKVGWGLVKIKKVGRGNDLLDYFIGKIYQFFNVSKKII
jgi:hypothetical protein